MGTWSVLDTVLLVLALAGFAAAFVFYRRSRSTDGSRGPVSLSATPTVSQTESALRAAELSDRLRMIHEQHAIVTRGLVELVARSEGSAFQSLENKSALQRHSRALVQTARQALNDMRRAMDIAQQGHEMFDEWPALDAITELFAEAEENGLIVNFEESGDRFPMSQSAELAIFRIVTEAIGNSQKHGGVGTEVDVLFTWGPHGLSISINDDGERAAHRRAAESGETPPDPVTIDSDQEALIEVTTGRGLLEMTSRAKAFDGVVHTQRVPGVGFNVSASFPMLRYATDPKSDEPKS
jgi:signal transduction histidine kinase